MSYGSILELTANESVSHTAYNTVAWDSEYQIDGPSWWSAGTPSRLTVPTAAGGMYGEIMFSGYGFGVGSMRVQLLHNGSVHTSMWSQAHTGNTHSYSIRTGVIQFVATDYWEVNIRTDTQAGSYLQSNLAQFAALTYERQGFTLATPPSGFTFNGNFGETDWHVTHDALTTIDAGGKSFHPPAGAKAVVVNATSYAANHVGQSYWYLKINGTDYGVCDMDSASGNLQMGAGLLAVAPVVRGDTIQPVYVGNADSPGGYANVELALEWVRGGTAQAGSVAGTGALVQPAGVLAGTGTNLGTVTGTGALTQPTQQLSGTGILAIDGTGALVQPAGALSGVGSVGGTHAGSGALAQGAGSLSGTGLIKTTGTGALTQPKGALSGSGLVIPAGTVIGSGALTQPAGSLSATGERVLTGSGALAQGAGSLAGSGTVTTASVPLTWVGFRTSDPDSGLQVTSTEQTASFNSEDIDTHSGFVPSPSGEFTVPSALANAVMIFEAGFSISSARDLTVSIEKSTTGGSTWDVIASTNEISADAVTTTSGPETLTTGHVYRMRILGSSTAVTIDTIFFSGWAI